MIKELIDDLLDEAAAQGTLEAIDDFASPLPVTVICRVLGIDTGERNWYRTRSALLGESVDPYPAFAGTQTPGLAERVRAERELTAFFTRLVADRRAAPREDLVSALVRAQDEGGLDEAEVVTTCRLLLNAGHETTVNLVGNGLLALTRAPDQLDLIRRDPGAADAAVEEILGLDPPLQLVHRHARTDMDVLGTHVPRGTTMVLLLAAANRDEAAVADAGRLDAGRATPRDHLSFGLGPHFCLGAPWAGWKRGSRSPASPSGSSHPGSPPGHCATGATSSCAAWTRCPWTPTASVTGACPGKHHARDARPRPQAPFPFHPLPLPPLPLPPISLPQNES